MSNIRSSQSRVEGWLLIVGKGKKADLVCISCTENHWARQKISCVYSWKGHNVCGDLERLDGPGFKNN